MTPFQIILSGLALSFCWVELLYPLIRVKLVKPFNCGMCMSGWFSFGLSLICGYTYSSILFLAVGVFVGAMFEALKMRYL